MTGLESEVLVSVAKQVVQKLFEKLNDYFCLNFDGSIVCNDSDLLFKDMQEVVTGSLNGTECDVVEKLVKPSADGIVNFLFTFYIKERLVEIEKRLIYSGWKIKAKLRLLDELADIGFEYVEAELSEIDMRYRSKGYRKKEKLLLLNELATKGLPYLKSSA